MHSDRLIENATESTRFSRIYSITNAKIHKQAASIFGLGNNTIPQVYANQVYTVEEKLHDIE